MVTTRTVGQYITRNGNRGEVMVQEGYRVVEVNDPTTVEDAITDLLHLLESIHAIQGPGYEGSDYEPRDWVIGSVSRAIGHYWSESRYAQDHADEDADVLGGIPIYECEVGTPSLTNH